MYLLPFNLNNKFGYKCGYEIKIPAIFELASSFVDKHAIVMLNGKFGLINNKGVFVVPNIYDELSFLCSNYYQFRINNKDNTWACGVIDVNNNVIITPKFKVIVSKEDNYFLCYEEGTCKNEDPQYYNINGRYTYDNLSSCIWYNKNGKRITNKKVVNQTKKYLIVQTNDFLGVLDYQGNEIIAPKYTSLTPCLEDVFLATKMFKGQEYYSVIKSNSVVILQEQTTQYVFENGFFNTIVEGKTIWFSYKGIKIYEGEACPLSKEFITISKNGKWGVINSDKERIINFLYDQIELLGECFAVLREDKIGLIGFRGEIIVDAVYNKIECVSIKNNPFYLGSKEDLIRVGIIDDDSYLGYCEDYCFDTNGHWDYKGNKYDALIHNTITTYRRCNADIILSCPQNFDLSKPLILTTDEYQELYTNEEGIISSSRFCRIQQITPSCFVVKHIDLYGVFNIELKSLIIPIEFERIKFMGGHTVLICKEHLWGATDLYMESHLFQSLFKVNIECKYSEIYILNEDQSLFGAKIPYKNFNDEEDPYFSILNPNGKETGNFYFQHIENPIIRYDDKHFLTSKQGKFGFITKSAYISIPFIYDEISPRKGGNFNIRIGNAWGIMNINGKEIVPPKYSQRIPLTITKPEGVIFEFDDLKDDTYQEVQTNGRGLTLIRDARSGFFGCLDYEGKEIIPTVFEHLRFSNNDILFYGCGGYQDDFSSNFFSDDITDAVWGCLDTKGEVLIEAKYDCFKIQDGFILAGRDGSFLANDDNRDKEYNDFYSGVYDLYTFDGELIIGGFREMYYFQKDKIYVFFFGGEWNRYCYYKNDWNNLYFYSYQFLHNSDLWLILDNELKTILRKEDGSQYQFYKGFIGTITIEETDKEISHVYNMPINLMAKGFKRFDKNCIIVGDCNDKDANESAIEIISGKQTPFYRKITQVSEQFYFFMENGLVGIRTIEDIVWEAEYIAFTMPVHGYFFAILRIDDNYSTVKLVHLSNLSNLFEAISSINNSEIIEYLSFGRLKIEIDVRENQSEDLKSIKVPQHSLFNETFINQISSEETNYFTKKGDNRYYFTNANIRGSSMIL